MDVEVDEIYEEYFNPTRAINFYDELEMLKEKIKILGQKLA
ncbi:hypothetical protein [Chryseobacterium sp. 3008163]|nr:hypothetical protein [Chryseobacterium sp. 3008163]